MPLPIPGWPEKKERIEGEKYPIIVVGKPPYQESYVMSDAEMECFNSALQLCEDALRKYLETEKECPKCKSIEIYQKCRCGYEWNIVRKRVTRPA
jgi:hypothetical protein